MEKIVTEKIHGGKLVRIKINFEKNIENIKITGDFFLYPEESIEKIENSLIGIDKNSSEEIITNKIKKIVKENNIELIGIDEESISKLIIKSIS